MQAGMRLIARLQPSVKLRGRQLGRAKVKQALDAGKRSDGDLRMGSCPKPGPGICLGTLLKKTPHGVVGFKFPDAGNPSRRLFFDQLVQLSNDGAVQVPKGFVPRSAGAVRIDGHRIARRLQFCLKGRVGRSQNE